MSDHDRTDPIDGNDGTDRPEDPKGTGGGARDDRGTDAVGGADAGARDEREARDEMRAQVLDLIKTPFYAWIGAGVRTVEILGDIGARVRAEEEARDAAGDSLGDDAAAAGAAGDREPSGIADDVAGRVADARRKVRDLGDNAGEQSREAFLKALDAAQTAFNDALTKAQAGGDRAFATAHSLPDDVAARAEQLKPEQLRAVADGYLEAASKIYRELAARGEQAVDEGVNVARERRASFGAVGFPGGRAGAEGDENKPGRATDPVSAIFGKLPFAGAAAERVTGSLEDVARETMKPLQDAGQEFLSRFDQDELSNRVESILHQAADVTEQLLGALRAESASAGSGEKAAEGDVVDAEPDVVDGEVVDLGGAENAAGMAADVPAADEAADAAETVSAGDEAVADAMGGEKAAAGETDADKADDAGSTGGADETKGDAADR
ncbi:hypothetical protein ACFORJ_03655 [Corynebacterium hansenii]|uniref:Uncharacterized protein n=1 Tax=Corynebacterium hansenii TaxID=394964 RepID=A0ABV7ZLW9_9CORY|nr:hypothetical protein [Corynebacterium hansenii]WJY98905.1 hypothetical protein CHAN_01350 [Corynebacterium hansenii]